MASSQTMVKVGGVFKTSITLPWVAGPAMANGFVSGGTYGPFEVADVTIAGRRLLFMRGTIVTPNPRPTVATTMFTLPVGQSYGYIRNDQMMASVAPWGAVGSRIYVYLDSVAARTVQWITAGTDVAGEHTNMAMVSPLPLVP